VSCFDPSTSILAGMDTATLQAQLAALQTVYIQLAAGKTVASAAYAQGDGNRAITYRNTDMGALVQSMIRQIQAQLGLIDQPRRSAGVSF
jgi:hypothetical protein